jgi:hypothetical protein
MVDFFIPGNGSYNRNNYIGLMAAGLYSPDQVNVTEVTLAGIAPGTRAASVAYSKPQSSLLRCLFP